MARWKSLIYFYLLCFLLLALIPLLAIPLNNGSMDFDAAAESASAVTGVAWTSYLWDVLRLSIVEPILWLVVLGSAIPSLAAIIVVISTRETQTLRQLLKRLHPTGGERDYGSALKAYGLLVLILVPTLALVYLIRRITGGIYDRGPEIFSLSLVPALLAAAFLDQGAVLEELGWRGYATHELQAKLQSPLGASLLVGVGWGLWHVPRDVTTGVIERLGTSQYLGLYLPSFLAGTIAISIIAAYFMNRLGGSLIPAIMVHGIINDAVGISGLTTITQALTPYHQITKALPLAIVAAALVISSKSTLLVESVKDEGS